LVTAKGIFRELEIPTPTPVVDQLQHALHTAAELDGVALDFLCVSSFCFRDNSRNFQCRAPWFRLKQYCDAMCIGSSSEELFVVRMSFRDCGLKGGKGGFGSLLRGGNSRAGQKKNENVSSMRDLQGRRVGDVENARDLERWNASTEDSTASSPANTEQVLNERFHRVNQGLNPEVKMCKFGSNCKYKHKCTLEHPVEDEPEDNSKKPIVEEAEQDEAMMRSSILAGLRRKRKAQTAPASSSSISSSSSCKLERQTESEANEPPLKKRQ